MLYLEDLNHKSIEQLVKGQITAEVITHALYLAKKRCGFDISELDQNTWPDETLSAEILAKILSELITAARQKTKHCDMCFNTGLAWVSTDIGNTQVICFCKYGKLARKIRDQSEKTFQKENKV